MILAGYTRVSTKRQLERDDAEGEGRGKGLATQQAEIESWCAANGHTIGAWYTDKALGGAVDLGTRLGLAEALSAVQAGQVEGIVVYKLDRWARDVILQEQLLADVVKAGGVLFSTFEGENDTLAEGGGPSRKMVRVILGAVAEYERAMIRLRMVAGAERKAAAGGYAYGRPPYGWRAVDGCLVADPAEQVVVARIRELRESGGRGGRPMGYDRIAATLNGEGLLRHGKGWHSEQVRRVCNPKMPVRRAS